MMALTRTLIRHAPTDYSALFVRGLPASIEAEEVRRYFCDKGYKCSVAFNKINNEYRKLYVALNFDSERTARDVYNKYDNEQILGFNVGLSYYKDKNRMYRDVGEDRSRVRRARVGQPVDKRRFNRTPSVSPERSRRRSRRSHSRSRSHSHNSDSDRSHHRSRSHSGSASPRRKTRSTSRERRKSRSHSFSQSPSRHSASPKRRRSKSPKSDSSRHRRSESPTHRRHSSSRHSISPKRASSLGRRSPSPSPRRKRGSRSRSRSSSFGRGRTPPEKRKLSASPSRKKTPSPPPLPKSKWDDDVDDDHDGGSPSPKKARHSPERTLPDEKEPSPQREPKDDDHHHRDKHSSQDDHHREKHSSRKKHHRKESRRKSGTPEDGQLSSSPELASSLSSSIYGKVASFTDMNMEEEPPKRTSSVQSKIVVPKVVANGNKSTNDDAEDVEADLRAEFLNNNDALYDSTRKKAEKILDDLPINPLTDGEQYVSKTVEQEFEMSNGDALHDKNANKKDDWTPEMITKLKAKKEEIVQAYKQDCDTFTTVVKMLISKDPDLEMRLQNALKENLKEIGQRCVAELHQVADALKTDELRELALKTVNKKKKASHSDDHHGNQ